MCADRPKRLRCAVYTRKSSEEGLEQAFNSLDAQREACESYIKSQVGEGWHVLRTSYDDGGVSGGTMDRPALRQLLADIKARKVDTVVVYKVDRLTRSLADFAKIVEVFDAHGVSFVSVTQQFNTTTSMGRLTLNMLLSFAQFEREVTGERIRDKIAASKKKGMWMGGFVPLGYDAKDRSLVINKPEAETVRTIYRLYLEHGNVRQVKEEADRLGLATKIRTTDEGRIRGGRPLSRGYIYKLLGNPIYVGRIAHKGATYEGQHQAIVDERTWQEVQAKLAGNACERRCRGNAAEPSLLAGLLHDDLGNRLSPSHAVKSGRRYRYYVSRNLIAEAGSQDTTGLRMPAREIEQLVCARIRSFLEEPVSILEALAGPDATARDQHRLVIAAGKQAKAWPRLRPSSLRTFLEATVERVTITDREIEIALSRHGLKVALLGDTSPVGSAPTDCNRLAEPDPLILRLEARLARCSREMRLVLSASDGTELVVHSDAALIKAVTRAHAWKHRLLSGQASSIRAIAKEEGMAERYVGRILRLAFLAPDIVCSILDGRQPAELELARLLNGIPLSWDEQRRVLGFPPRA